MLLVSAIHRNAQPGLELEIASSHVLGVLFRVRINGPKRDLAHMGGGLYFGTGVTDQKYDKRVVQFGQGVTT